MKKIFAIALAVVMVLSMASAFALSACATWNPSWACVDDDVWCGQGKVEVVPYVKVNTSCGVEYQVSDCATAIKTEEVFFAIKLTVDAYPDPAWWEEAELDLETVGLTTAWSYEDDSVIDFGAAINLDADGMITDNFLGIDYDADEEEVYYLSRTGAAFVPAEDAEFDFDTNVVFEKTVDMYDVCSAEDVSVCAELTSYYNGYKYDAFKPYNQVGDYFIRFDNETFNKKGEMTAGDFVVYTDDDTITFNVKDGKVYNTDTTECSAAFAAQVERDFNMSVCGLETCMNEANFEANFGWDFEQEDCFNWSDKGASVVDTDCVVAIPKTGDASVLAWLF